MRNGQASRTAMMVAYLRALADRGVTSVPGFTDPVAQRLLTGPGWRLLLRVTEPLAAQPDSEGARRMREWLDGLTLRVAFIDAVVGAAEARQVVILGAGLDTRAWRLEALRGARVFEVDHPDTQAWKRARTPSLGTPLAEVTFVPVDFARDNLATSLRAAGHDAARPTVWIWEGVIMYLGDDALRRTLADVRALSAPGSTLLAHYHEPEPSVTSSMARRFVFGWLGEPQLGLRTRQTMREELTRAGFAVAEDAGLDEQAARVGAPPPLHTRLRVSRIVVAH